MHKHVLQGTRVSRLSEELVLCESLADHISLIDGDAHVDVKDEDLFQVDSPGGLALLSQVVVHDALDIDVHTFGLHTFFHDLEELLMLDEQDVLCSHFRVD